MNVKDVMTTNIITVDKDVNLKYVLELMKKNDISKIPVLEDKKLVGIVTDNIIAYKLGSIRKKGVSTSSLYASSVTDKNVHCISPETRVKTILRDVGKPGPTMLCVIDDNKLVGVITKADLIQLVLSNKPVREIMKSKIFTVAPNDRVIHARRIMIDEDIARIPVLDEGRLVGMITDIEIAFALASLKSSISRGHQKHKLEELIVSDVMKHPVHWIEPNITTMEAAKIMIEKNIGALPILENNRLIGIISRTDLLNTISR
jgi:CBS domain-containing protein